MAVEHDLICFDGPFFRYDGTLAETADGTACVNWAGREDFGALTRNYCRVPYGNPYGDTQVPIELPAASHTVFLNPTSTGLQLHRFTAADLVLHWLERDSLGVL